MDNRILDGVSLALKAARSDVEVYAEKDVEQRLDPPAFFIKLLDTTRSPLPSKRYLYGCSLDVHYFPGDEGSHTEIAEVASALFDVLEVIDLPPEDGSQQDAVRGFGLRAEPVDGVLHFFVTYKATLIRKRVDGDLMEILDTQIGV